MVLVHISLRVGAEFECTQQRCVLLAAVNVEVTPARRTPTIGIIVVGSRTYKIRFVITRISGINVMCQICCDLIVIIITFVEVVTECCRSRCKVIFDLSKSFRICYFIGDIDVSVFSYRVNRGIATTLLGIFIRQSIGVFT